MVIIPAASSHIPGIVTVWKELMDFHGDIDPFFARSRNGHIHFATYVRDLITSDDAQVLVAIDQGKVVAFSISYVHVYPPIFRVKRGGFISDLAVTSRYRRRGIGGKMLEKIVEWFASRGLDRIELRVAAHNEIGYNFWKKHGFEDYMHVMYKTRE
jgi:ribosomal protein S18 acetylase RimI-like enzyme